MNSVNELQMFNFEDAEVRTVLIDEIPYFVGKDIADILGYSRSSKAINDHVDKTDQIEKIVNISQSSQNGTQSEIVQNVKLVNESGVYELIFNSKLPKAKKFKRWVTSEVLPTIRKHGTYMTDEKIEEALLNPDTIINLATQLKNERANRKLIEQQVTEMKPKAIFADSVATSKTTILVGELAKIIKQNGISLGAKRLFAWLRENGYLIKRMGTDYNSPTQKSMELGLFEIKESSHVNGNGVTIVTKTPKVTGKGQLYFVNKFLAMKIEEKK